MRRRLFLLLALLILVAVLGMLGLYLDGQREGRVSQANVDCIKVGITLARVEELLGGPAEDLIPDEPPSRDRLLLWNGGGGAIVLIQFHDDRVEREPSYSAPSRWQVLELVCKRLGL